MTPSAARPETYVRPSVLDRLIEGEGARTASAAGSVAQIKDAVRRDLEWLLNTRRTPESVPDDFVEVLRSVDQYGIPDVTSMSRDSSDDRRRLRRTIEETVSLFEPRFEYVRVSERELAPRAGGGLPPVHFVVEGMLRLDPTPIRVKFEVLEAEQGEYRVREDG